MEDLVEVAKEVMMVLPHLVKEHQAYQILAVVQEHKMTLQ